MDALVASPFALLDAHSSLRLVTDAVHENDALCLALTCRALRDALGARFPACPRAGCQPVARLAARVTAAGVLDLGYYSDDESDDGDDFEQDYGLHALPEGFGRLAYLPRREIVVSAWNAPYRSVWGPGLRKLDLSGNAGLTALPEGLWSLAGLEELILERCGLTVLSAGIEGLVGLRKIHLR
jgi:hypothetical protein